jgi:hypothetical protein
MTGILFYEAVYRLLRPEKVDGQIMFWVALIGVGMNGVLMVRHRFGLSFLGYKETARHAFRGGLSMGLHALVLGRAHRGGHERRLDGAPPFRPFWGGCKEF